MTKREKLIWCIFGAILGVLFLLSFTDLIIKEKKAEIYPISVVLDSTTDECYANFKKGVEQAARDYNADVHFVTLYQEGDALQQEELIEREIKGGAQAVIVAPVRELNDPERLESLAYSCPIILLGNHPRSEERRVGKECRSRWSPVTSVIRDYEKEGELLGRAVAEQIDSVSPVYVFAKEKSAGNNRPIYEAFVKMLKTEGFEAVLCSRESGSDFKTVFETILYPEAPKAALDAESMTEAAQILNSDDRYTGRLAGVFGVGSTTYLLNQMDKGLIRGLVVHNSYNEGYLSIQKAADGIKKGMKQERICLDSYYIERSDIRSRKFEKMLYPMD